MLTRNSGTSFPASRAPAWMTQQCEICCFTRSSSLVVSCEPKGATGCEEVCCCAGAAFDLGCVSCGVGAVGRVVRFFSSESNATCCCFWSGFGASGFVFGFGAFTGFGGSGLGGSGVGGSGFGGAGFGAG